MRSPEFGDAREECPLVTPWHETLVQEDAMAAVPRPLLQGQRNEVTKSALRQCVLVREQPVVGIQADVRPSFHGLCEEMRPEPSGQRRWNGLLEEEPDMPTSPRSRPLQGGLDFEPSAHCEEGCGVVLPIGFIEIDR